MATWTKVERQTDDGTIAQMQAPLIISASRSTDIPAFYADWFFNRLNKGYSAWTNPFNGVKTYISYENTRFIVFWSKNPRPLIPYLKVLKEHNIKCYIQYTLNDYEKEHLENRVPPLDYRIETFKLLVEQLGKGSVIWRFDPLIITDDITIYDLLQKVKVIGNELKGYTEKLVFSFADIAIYKKVKHNLESNNIPYHEWQDEQMNEFAYNLSKMNEELDWNYQLATCGEKIDLHKYKVTKNKCVDWDLITRLAWEDTALMKYMNVKIESSLFGESDLPKDAIMLPNNQYFISSHKKDSGQRLFCECMASKDIGEYNTCPHLCEYCYANSSKQIAFQNWERHQLNKYSDTITGV